MAGKQMPTSPTLGQPVRVHIPKSRDPVQRTVVAFVSEIDDADTILAWCMPSRTTPEFTVQVSRRSVVTDATQGWWEPI